MDGFPVNFQLCKHLRTTFWGVLDVLPSLPTGIPHKHNFLGNFSGLPSSLLGPLKVAKISFMSLKYLYTECFKSSCFNNDLIWDFLKHLSNYPVYFLLLFVIVLSSVFSFCTTWLINSKILQREKNKISTCWQVKRVNLDMNQYLLKKCWCLFCQDT